MNKVNSKALYIYSDIRKTYTEQVNIHYEGKSIVGLDIDNDINAIDYIDTLIRRLEVYNEKLRDIYSIANKKPIKSVQLKMSHIYMMKNIRNGYIKIGRSNNPEFRERTLQSEAPEIELIFSSPLTFAANEKRLHSILSHKRIRGEWFDLNDEEVLFVKNYSYGN